LFIFTNLFFQALIDGPKDGASRQVISLSHVNLLPVVLPKFPRGARSGTVAKKWATADVEKKFESTGHAKKIALREKRSSLTDFERFVVARLKKQVLQSSADLILTFILERLRNQKSYREESQGVNSP
jgi:ribosomal protein L14E/L6E/L27E